MTETQTIGELPVELPDPQDLAQAQVCGRACVWCAVALDNAAAVDLGDRDVGAHGSVTRWFPRRCRPCGYTHLYAALQAHRESCKQCTTSLPWCIRGQRLFGAAMRISEPVRR